MPLSDTIIRLEVENEKLKTALRFACMELAGMYCPIENHEVRARRVCNCAKECTNVGTQFQTCWDKYFNDIADGIIKHSKENTGGV